MKKIPSLFNRDWAGDRSRVVNEPTPGTEWVTDGAGWATVKFDGTACLVRDRQLYRRYDRKLPKAARKRKDRDPSWVPTIEDFKSEPSGWEPCEPEPNTHTGHWPGWLPVTEKDKWYMAAWENNLDDGTYELVGPHFQSNPYGLDRDAFWAHGEMFDPQNEPPRDFAELMAWFADHRIEGIVWYHPDGRMIKIKRRDFGYDWPLPH